MATEMACLLYHSDNADAMRKEIKNLIAAEDAVILLAFIGERAAAFAQCQLRRDYVEGTHTTPVGYLEGIFVREKERGKGIARMLLHNCEDWARKKGCTEFASDCELSNTCSQIFHARTGFSEANRIVCFIKHL